MGSCGYDSLLSMELEPLMDSKEIAERLDKNPALKAAVEKLLAIPDTEHPIGPMTTIHAAEEFVIEASRELNKEVLQAWSTKQAVRNEKHLKEKLPKTVNDIKKK